MRDHTKLRAFELADDLALLVYRCTTEFPHAEQFGLTAQMRRAAISIAANIVEGSARESLAEYLGYLEIAHASARELEYHISLAHRLEYLSRENAEELERTAIETSKVLNGLLRSLREKKQRRT